MQEVLGEIEFRAQLRPNLDFIGIAQVVLFADLDVLVHVVEFGLHVLEGAGAAHRNIRSDILQAAGSLPPEQEVACVKVFFG